MFALIDCNNFYASCERVFRPDLRDKPVVILSNNDGCIIARSGEAKLLGIKMGQPAFEIERFLIKNNVAIFSSNYALYGDMSRRVMNVLGRYTPSMEIYSIDEAFLDFTSFKRDDLQECCEEIRKKVLRETGIPISIGVASTKSLAKVACKFAKRYKKLNHLLILKNPDMIEKALRKTEVRDIWGIGRRYAQYLEKMNIRSAWEFTRMNDTWVRKKFSVMGLRIKKELLGRPCIEMEIEPPRKKAICTSRSFGAMITTLPPLEEAVSTFASRCALKLRNEKSLAHLLMVFIHTNSFRENDAQYSQNRVIKLPVATHSTLELVKYAKIALRDIYKKGYRYKKAGVVVSGIVPDKPAQACFFDRIDRKKHDQLMKTMDKINNTWGRDSVKVAAQGSGQRWKLRRENLSPSYTTQWREIITIKV